MLVFSSLLSRLLIVFLGFAGAAAAYIHGPACASRIEAMIARDAAAALEPLIHDWARIESDGRELRVSGVAPDEETSELLAKRISAVRLAKLDLGGLTVAAPTPLSEYNFNAAWDGRLLTLSGLVPDKQSHDALIKTSLERAGLRTEDKTKIPSHFVRGCIRRIQGSPPYSSLMKASSKTPAAPSA